LASGADDDAKSQVTLAQSEAKANRVRRASVTPQLLELRRLENQRALIDRCNEPLPQVESGSGKRLTHAHLTGKGADFLCHPEAGTEQEEPFKAFSRPVVLRRVAFFSGCFFGNATFGA
jgi:hypothetical protein